jgi:hypothetical protein
MPPPKHIAKIVSPREHVKAPNSKLRDCRVRAARGCAEEGGARKGSPKAALRTPQRLYSRGGDLPLRAIADETESREAGDHHRPGLSRRAGEMSRETKKSMNPPSPTIICPASKPSHSPQPDCPVRAMRGGVLKAFALAPWQNDPLARSSSPTALSSSRKASMATFLQGLATSRLAIAPSTA